MWLNPLACMGTGRPLISSCLMRDIDRPHLTQRPARRRAWAAPAPRPPPPFPFALVRLDAIKNEKKMEASNVGGGRKKKKKNRCCGTTNRLGPWLDLWERASIYFFISVSLSLSLGDPPPVTLSHVHAHGHLKAQENTRVLVKVRPELATVCGRLKIIPCDSLRGLGRLRRNIRVGLALEGSFFPIVHVPFAALWHLETLIMC